MLTEKLKEKARILRMQGGSLKEISELLNISKSTASLWLRGCKLSSLAISILEEKSIQGRKKGNDRQKDKALQNEKRIHILASQYVSTVPFSQEQSKGLCALLYGCEGSKNETGRAAFINSDPELIRFFLVLFRKAFTIDEKKFRVLMHLHEYHDEKKQLKFWSDITSISETRFSKTFQKKNGKKNIRENYQGCISVRYNSGDVQKELISVYRKILRQEKS